MKHKVMDETAIIKSYERDGLQGRDLKKLEG
jgi:hypothetical protein